MKFQCKFKSARSTISCCSVLGFGFAYKHNVKLSSTSQFERKVKQQSEDKIMKAKALQEEDMAIDAMAEEARKVRAAIIFYKLY